MQPHSLPQIYNKKPKQVICLNQVDQSDPSDSYTFTHQGWKWELLLVKNKTVFAFHRVEKKSS